MSVFYVYQGDTYKLEKAGGYVWSPKLTKSGQKNAGYLKMTEVKKNDFILHNCNGKVVALSIAKSDCYDANIPLELKKINAVTSWNADGYRIDTTYYELDTPLAVTKHKNWLAAHYESGSAFTVAGTGKQQYMCSIADVQAVYLIENATKQQSNSETIKMLEAALRDIIDDKDLEYDHVEKETIDAMIDSEIEENPKWPGRKEKQALMASSSAGRERPKRNTKVAVDALRRAEFKCEFNKADKTFLRKNGKAYTAPHHLIPLGKYRDFDYSVDVMENVVSLCSHCHNLLHYGRLEDKKQILKKLYEERAQALGSVGLDLTFEQLLGYYK